MYGVEKLNIRHFFIVLACENDKCREVIDYLYYKNEEKYFRLYKNSEMYEDIIKNSLSAKSNEYANKLIGILEEVYKTNNFFIIEKIISAFDNKLVRYCKKNNPVDITEYYKSRIDVSMSELEMLTYSVFLYYYCFVNKKNVIASEVLANELVEFWRETYLKSFKYGLLSNEFFEEKDFKKQIKEDFLNSYNIKAFDPEKYYEKLSLNFSIKILKEKKTMSINALIDNIIYQAEKDEKLEERMEQEHLSFEEYSKERMKIFRNHSVIKHIGAISLMYNMFGINSLSVFENAEINMELLNDCIFASVILTKTNNYSIEDLGQLFINIIFSRTISTSYMELKDALLNKSKIDKLKDLEKFEKELKKEEEKINRLKKDNKDIINSKDIEIKELKNKLKLLNQKLNTLEKENNNNEKILNEKDKKIDILTNKLNKEIIANKHLKIEEVKEVPFEEKIKLLNNKNIVIIGGANNIGKIKDYIPNINLINELNKDLSHLKNYDNIFINCDFISHAFIYKINSSNLIYNYISGTNIEKIIDKIYSILNSNS